MQVAKDNNIREILGWQETEKFIYCLMKKIENTIENYFKKVIDEKIITKEIYKFGLQELEFVKKIKEKWGIVDIGKLKKENIIIRKNEETITNLEICNMEKLEFKGQEGKEKYERKKKEKRSYINEIGQIFYEVIKLKKDKKKKKKKSKEEIEKEL